MTISQAAKQTLTDGVMLIRYRANSHKETGTAQYDVKPYFTGSKRGWIALDAMTAGAINACHESLAKSQKPEMLAKFDNIPLGKLVDFCWRHVA